MKLRSLLFLVILSVGLLVKPQTGQATPSGWEPVGPGIDYQEFHLPGPNNAFVARMDRNNPSVTLETSLAQGKINNDWKFERVSSMARRYDQAINYWGENWGNRNRVVVAINGSYFEKTTGFPDRGVFHSGWYDKQFTNSQNGSGFGWTLDRNAFIGECVNHPVGKQLIRFANGNTVTFNAVNVFRGEGELILYTPQFDDHTGTNTAGVEVLVELSQPNLVLSSGSSITGIVREVRKNQGSTPIPFDHLVLSGQGLEPGMPGMKLWNNAEVGAEIRISQEIRNFKETDCKTPIDLNWSRTFAGLGGDYHFIKNGKIQIFPNNAGATYRHPRTAIAYNNDSIFFIVVDGRNQGVSIGMTIQELATFAKQTLGATDALAVDGGGSSTMVVDGVVRNIPSDGIQPPPPKAPVRKGYSDMAQLPAAQGSTGDYNLYLPIIRKTDSTQAPPANVVERGVVNGLMMVVVEPRELSGKFSAYDPVVALETAAVRLGPGTNYGILSTVSAHTTGAILPHNLDGVQAKGDYWWKVDFGGAVIGWVSERSLGRLGSP